MPLKNFAKVDMKATAMESFHNKAEGFRPVTLLKKNLVAAVSL